MTQREREKTARRHLYGYALYVREIRQYERSVYGATRNETGIRGSEISDPTARSGMALAEPPADLQRKRAWIEAIDAAIDELRQMDAGNAHGYVYICTHIYGLNGQRHKRRENTETSLKVANDCTMSVAALYYRVKTIVSVVIYHAGQRGLFEEKK